MKLFKCIKSLLVDLVDDDGFTLINQYIDIPEGSIWYMTEDEDYRFVGGEIRLESEEIGWIEISKETFQKYFEEVARE